MYRLVVILILFFPFFRASSQSASQVLSRIENKKWAKAERIITKALLKDSANIEMKYVASLLFFNEGYPHYNLDSSYHYLLSSLHNYSLLTVRDKDKMKRFPIDSIILNNHKTAIDAAAFVLAKSIHTEEAYRYFITHHPSALQLSIAVELRDEVAFLEAMKVNTHFSYAEFLNKYPSSHRTAEAQRRYDQLIYEDRTQDEKLISYENFVREFPSSPYSTLAMQQVMQIATANGSRQSFIDFIDKYPRGKWSEQARNILFHLDDDSGHASPMEMTDSLRQVEALNHLYWVPFYKDGQYGFMDAEGKEKIAPAFNEVLTDYLCGAIRSDYLITSKGVISRSGKLIFAGKTEEVDELGDGYLKIQTATSLSIIHKSGFTIHTEDIADTRMVAGRFIAVKRASGWGLLSLTGRLLLPYVYVAISSFDDWIVLTKNTKKILVTANQIGEIANKIVLSENRVYDDVRRWGENLCWVKNGSLEGVLNEELNFVIPLDRHVLTKTPFGFLRARGEQQFVEGITELQNISFDEVAVQGQWMSTKVQSRLQLYDINTGKRIVTNADSIWFDKNIAMVKARDSVHAWINPGVHLDFNRTEKTMLFGNDSYAWMMVADKNRKIVYDAITGQRLFTGDFDQIENVSKEFFLLSKANKKGLADARGKMILAMEYDAIIQSEPGRLSLLKDKKFGLFDMMSKKLIKPLYERNLVQYNQHWFVAFKDGGWGFIDLNSKPVGKFQFNEVKFWNDTAAWVKENFQWKIYDITTAQVLQDKIKDFRYVKKYPHEHVVIIHQDNRYGVISNRNGIIIPSTFSDIVNIGDAEYPMYFTEKHIEEADISIVIYYDFTGKLLRRQAFESAEEYERIYCDQK